MPLAKLMCRAIQVVIVPLSVATIASSRSSLFSSNATTSGFIGVSVRLPRSSISSRHSAIAFWHLSRKLRSSW